jgi:hypothetical protein
MFLAERFRRNPPQRSPTAPEPRTDDDSAPEPEVGQPDVLDDADAWDEADELAAMPDADFLRELRADVLDVREGLVPSITDAIRLSPKDRPWGPRHKVAIGTGARFE